MFRTRKERAAVYRKAAKLMEKKARHSDGYIIIFSCCAVAEAEGVFDRWNCHAVKSSLVDNYRDIFDGSFSFDSGHRITALCMMAALVEAGDA